MAQGMDVHRDSKSADLEQGAAGARGKDEQRIVLFGSADGEVSLSVNVEEETVWLTQAQMAELFDRTQPVIARHIANVFKEKELVKEGNMHFLHIASSARPVAIYSLDVIIFVGYRVKSQRGVEFRRWATSVLKRYILQGHVENDARLQQLGTIVQIIERLPGELASREILDIVESYTSAYELLDAYDRSAVPRPQGARATYVLDYDECMALIAQMRPRFASDIFGCEKDDSFRSSIAASTSRSAARSSIPRSRRKPLTCYISSSRTIRSWTATSVSPAASSSTSSTATARCSAV